MRVDRPRPTIVWLATPGGAMLAHVVLGILRDGKLRHGYEVMTEYRARTGAAPSPGTFYRELSRLTDRGLVVMGANPTDADPRRIPYQVTDNGRRIFDRWLASPPLVDGELGSWLLFVDRVPAADRARLLDRWVEELWLRNKNLARDHRLALESEKSDEALPTDRTLRRQLARHMRHLGADLAFLEDIRQEVCEETVVRESAKTADSPPPKRRPSQAKR